LFESLQASIQFRNGFGSFPSSKLSKKEAIQLYHPCEPPSARIFSVLFASSQKIHDGCIDICLSFYKQLFSSGADPPVPHCHPLFSRVIWHLDWSFSGEKLHLHCYLHLPLSTFGI
ncbi:MAG TPA: hypothetical protein V6D20_14115, partial [Candidatus Obscuribacterales bacterium]